MATGMSAGMPLMIGYGGQQQMPQQMGGYPPQGANPGFYGNGF